MPFGNEQLDSRQQLDLPLEQMEPATGREQVEILGAKAPRVLVRRMMRPLPVSSLQMVGRSREGKDALSSLDPRRASRMVEVEVGEDHVGDLLPGTAGPAQVSIEAVDRLIDSVHFAVLLVPLGSDPAVDQHPAVAVLDEQTAQGQLDAVALVDRMPLLPQRLGT